MLEERQIWCPRWAEGQISLAMSLAIVFICARPAIAFGQDLQMFAPEHCVIEVDRVQGGLDGAR